MLWLYASSLGAACISGVTGLAGGTILLSVLSLFFPPQASIAQHGLLQVVANFSRIILFRKDVLWKHVVSFSVLVIPGAYLGALCAPLLSENLLKFMLGILILWVAWKNKTKVVEPQNNKKIFLPLGGLSGFLGMIIGVTGPLLAPFFLKAGIVKENFIATKALCQFIVQLIKVIIFASMLDFDYQKEGEVILIVSVMLILGTYIAKKILPYVSNNFFVMFTRVILTLIGFKLIFSVLSTLVAES